MDNYSTIVANRVKADVLGKEGEGDGKRLVEVPSEFDQDLSFSMFKSAGEQSSGVEKEEDQGNVEEQLRQLVEERMKQIKAVVEKVSA